MATLDDKAKEASAETVDGADDENGSVDNLSENQAKKDAGGSIILFFIVGFVASLIVGWVLLPQLLYSQKEQPVDFNHVIHNEELDDDCESCHYFRDDGTFAGVPDTYSCAECHEEVLGETEAEEFFVAEYVEKEKEIPWMIYSKQPDCVFFSHAAHVKMAQIECAECHGNVGKSEHLKTYEENRITGYSRDIWGKNIAGLKKYTYDRMKMDDCAECHKKMNDRESSVQTKKDACFVCHK